MIKNYFKTAWRTMVKDKTYATINILGLTIGLCACMMVGTVVLDDLSYDHFWTHKNELYRIITVDTAAGLEGKNASAYTNIGNEFKNNFPEVERAAAVQKWQYDFRKMQTADETIPMSVIKADTNIWMMLDFTILEGNPHQYIAGVGNLIITERFRNIHFPNENPIGKTIYSVSAYDDEAKPFQITGIMADLPSNTYLRADGLQITEPSSMVLNREGWGYYEEQMLLMKPNTDMAGFAKKANRWYREFLTDASESAQISLPTYEFQPIEDIYLKSDFSYQSVKGDLSNIYIFSVVAALLLAIACINFVNLSTARAMRRLRETGVRKVLGAEKRQLIFQFLIEGLLFFGISTVLACGLYALFLPPLEGFVGHLLTIRFTGNLPLFLSFIATIFLIALITSAYPAWMLSGFRANNALRNRFGSGVLSSAAVIRKALVVTQFGLALLVLIGMITIWRQMQFMADKDLGYNPSNVLSIPSFITEGNGNTLKQEIVRLPGVKRVSLTEWIPTKGTGGMMMNLTHPQRPDEQVQVSVIFGDADLPALLELHLSDGRLFDQREENTGFNREMMFSQDKNTRTRYRYHAKALLTASTAKLFDVADLDVFAPSLNATPVGIIDDFHSVSLRDPIKPTVIHANENMKYAYALIKVKTGHEANVMRGVNKLWKQFHPEKPLKLEWLDDLVKKQYEKEAKQAQLFTFFSALTLFLASLGIFGLVVHTTEQRVKEIGIRKVLGASVGSIVRLFSVDYIKLVGIALLVASPLAWWAMNKWLQDFAYRIDIEWWMFAVAGLAAVMIALATVSWQAIRAAVANPVDSLRDE
ncbi:FtsX-like permease family protein [Parapedobacter tibetensis]|uniref:FtsX-like permease family protein n=1 Tax=Parapedobacter tibetensis TaxID=2972951 RepID=UPI00214D4CAA|nr:FtsX-like permease family protein [Parapedobacter tibetensis]